ncbi:hypothetical protein J7E73_03185 [Paenibacillus albidus]|nr:hypothetical protein [Paenibacillus albidus]
MDNILLWCGLVLLITLLTFLNQKPGYSSKVKKAYRELRELADRVVNGQSSGDELENWEQVMAELAKHPNEYNKLELEIGLRGVFVLYLERHYPQDSRLPALKEAAAHQKDTIWGLKMGDYGSKK